MNQNRIIARGLALGYATQPIISDVTLTIQSGEFIGILGPNGAGKSTFLHALLGLMKPLAGDLQVLGARPKQGHQAIGYMPQWRSSESAIANLTSRALIKATACFGRHTAEEIQHIIELVKADSYVDRPFYQLSGGERQRVYLAQALLGYPHLLLLDEPLANLDPRYQETFIHLLHHIQQQLNVTILLTAHDANPLLQVMNRVLYFAKGKAVIGSVQTIMTSETLSALYETPIEVVHYKERLIVLGEDSCRVDHHD